MVPQCLAICQRCFGYLWPAPIADQATTLTSLLVPTLPSLSPKAFLRVVVNPTSIINTVLLQLFFTCTTEYRMYSLSPNSDVVMTFGRSCFSSGVTDYIFSHGCWQEWHEEIVGLPSEFPSRFLVSFPFTLKQYHKIVVRRPFCPRIIQSTHHEHARLDGHDA